MSAPLDDDALSRLAADALRVVSGAQEWARQTFAEFDAQGHADGHTASSGADCQWCPLCQFVAVLRGERPELTERVAEAGAAVVTALRAALDAAARPSTGGQHRAGRDTEDASRDQAGAQRPRVQHIDLGATGASGGARPGADPEPDAHPWADPE